MRKRFWKGSWGSADFEKDDPLPFASLDEIMIDRLSKLYEED